MCLLCWLGKEIGHVVPQIRTRLEWGHLNDKLEEKRQSQMCHYKVKIC